MHHFFSPAAKSILFLCALVLVFCPAGFSAAQNSSAGPAATQPEPEGGICYRGATGFMLNAPEGWVNLREAAQGFGVCFFFVPAGYNLDNAPAVLYPNLIAVAGDADPAEAAALNMLEKMRSRPGGENTQLVSGGPCPSTFGEDFTVWYFDDAPPPNNFEVVAYYPQGDVMLIVVLSATKEQHRLRYHGDFLQTLHGILPITVASQDE